jgi:hypothetical protein
VPIIDTLELWDTIKDGLNKGGRGKTTVVNWDATNEVIE